MQADYFFFYAEANIVCIITLGFLFFFNRAHSTRQEKEIWFERTLIAHILYFLSDIGWAAVLGGQLPRTRFLILLFNSLNYVFLSLMAYNWFMYMAASTKLKFVTSRQKRLYCLLPMVISCLAIVIAYLADPEFWVSPSGELAPLYYPMLIAAPVIYLFSAFVLSMIQAGRAESREDAALYRLIGIYPLGVLLFGLIQTYTMDAPLFCFGCTIMMLFFYIRNIQAQVSIDPLTHLNNRGQINRYMRQVKYRDNVKTFAMMMDIDNFKKINDTFGHAEGDRALVLVSDVLKKAVDRPVFLGRYGGDEFTLFFQCGEGDTLPDQAVEKIRALLKEKQQDAHLLYNLSISVGYDRLRDKNDTLEACLNRADQKLYENKRAARIGR